MKLLLANSAITEVNELKYIKFALIFFEYKFFIFITLSPSGRTRLI